MESSPQFHNAILIAPSKSINLKSLNYRYPTRNAVTMEAELKQIEIALSHKFLRLGIGKLKQETLAVVGYGPSLKDTWEQVTHPCITTSGAHDFLIQRGFIPDFHAQCDGRDHQVKFLERPHHHVTYVMATICPPAIWERLKKHRVLLWHNCNGQHVLDWIGEHDPGGILIAGGSNIGLSAIHIGGLMGYRKFKCFGFDGNFDKDWNRHAGVHHDPTRQDVIRRWVGQRKWFTSPQMSNSADEFLTLMQNKDIQLEVVGECMLADLVKCAN